MRLIVVICLAIAFSTEAQTRRALLIGIDDYSASTLPRPAHVTEKNRGWDDLKGAANDVRILREILVAVYGFDPKHIVTLTNQQATRKAILRSIEHHLVRPASKGDVVFYYYAGHGAQVPNPESDEPDRLDESIVPADSRWGAPDIRDKELRPYFDRVLDRGAHLTLLLDHCHSGSSFRGGRRVRGIRRARAIADAKDYGERPEERGALVIVSAQDHQMAGESRGDDGRMHGSFTWAWIRALRDAVSGESAEQTFLRAQARTRLEAPSQTPAILGRTDVRRRPFLGTRIDRRGNRAIVAVERIHDDGSVVLQGGWANGLSAGCTLRNGASHFRITKILGLGRSIATRESGPRVQSGALLEVTGWAAMPGRPFSVWASSTLGPTLRHDGIVLVDDATNADVVLTSRTHAKRVEYAWFDSTQQQRTRWVRDEKSLRESLLKLRYIHAWHHLESPPNVSRPYRLALRHEKTKKIVRDHTVIGNDIYSVVLEPNDDPTPRYYYIFIIDTHGKSYLAYPKRGSIENRFPLRNDTTNEIAIGDASAFRVLPPYGTDTYFLLSTDEPLANPSVLAWDGVRKPEWSKPLTPLEQLFVLTISGARGARPLIANDWSIERVTFQSKPPESDRRRRSAARDSLRWK